MSDAKSFSLWLLKFIGFLGLLALCLWLALRPKSPSHSILFISIHQPLSSSQNGTIFYTLEIENPNKDSSIYYDDILLSFLYGEKQDNKVGETTIASFHQGKSKSRVVSEIVNTKRGSLKHLISNAISNATSELKVALMTRIRYKTWGIKSKFHGLNLNGVLPIGSDGKLVAGKKYKLTSSSKKLARSKIKH